MITPEQKDHILIKLIDQCDDYIKLPSGEEFGLSNHRWMSLLQYFQRRGLIRIKPQTNKDHYTTITTEIEADDFIQRGGFQFEEDAYRNNFTKLELELAKLEGEIPQEKFSNIMTLISTASAAVSAYTGLS